MELYTAFAQSAQTNSERTALIWEKENLIYSELLERCNTIGNMLKKRNSQRRHIALLAPNSPHFIYGLFGILGSGQIAIPFNPLLNPEELANLLVHSDSKELLYDPFLKEKAEQAVQLTGLDIELLSIPELLETRQPNNKNLSPDIGEDEASMILYTSGTTGNPKGVILSHKNIHSNYLSFKSVLDFQPIDTFICSLPLHHTYAMTVNLFGSLLIGARLMLFSQFDPRKIVEALLTEPNVIYAAVSPMLMMLARFAPEDAAKNHRLRYVISGGGPLPDEVFYAFQKKYNHEILQGYGLTETSPVVTYNRPGKNKIGTIGPVLPGVEVQIRSEQGELLGTDEIGELCVRGDLVMKGYYKDPEGTRNAFYDGNWLRTSDMASIDEDGYIKIAGRLKDLIISGGENIYPQEVEDTLIKHPAVHEAAVVAQPDRLRSEIPHAFIVLVEEAKGKIKETELRKFCREHLAEYKIPEAFTFLDEMPRTAKGTVEKKELRRRLEKA
ncbi:MAG: AMP-binding protein [Candidatus Omnitrophica bacterium]|nr:AMP-binding protein [Candidatus Omnitrophota bacterium]